MLIGGIIGGILAVGVLLLLLWKCVSMSLDHREMERFKKERTSAVWNTVSILFKIHFTVVVT
uniref:Uncharacterized protein n=2 Tax=Octopus bimaculoides TaxID=37653 RepID=A0A0L8HIX2_OCTBM